MGRELQARCDMCMGLCCVAPAFSRSSDFAIDKRPGEPCPNLDSVFRCSVHDQLRERGFPGCVTYDCFGAGQRITSEVVPGVTWTSAPARADEIFRLFGLMRRLHEHLWHLREALAIPGTDAFQDELAAAVDATEAIAGSSIEQLGASDIDAHHLVVTSLLRRVSARIRGPVAHPALDRLDGDLVGGAFVGADLTGANLRGARLIGADLRHSTLTRADLTGADVRGADVSGADLNGALFVTQSQLQAMKGDDRTRIPPTRARPDHWKRLDADPETPSLESWALAPKTHLRKETDERA